MFASAGIVSLWCKRNWETLLAKLGWTNTASSLTCKKPDEQLDPRYGSHNGDSTINSPCFAHALDRIIRLTFEIISNQIVRSAQWITYDIAMEDDIGIHSPYPVVFDNSGMSPKES